MTRDGSDKLRVKVVRPGMFKSASTNKRIKPDSFKDPNTFMYSDLPPIMADAVQAENIMSTTYTGGSILNTLSTGNFVIGLILGGSMQ